MCLENIDPPLKCSATQAAQLASQSFIPLQIPGDRQFLLSLRHGTVKDRGKLLQVLQGTLNQRTHEL